MKKNLFIFSAALVFIAGCSGKNYYWSAGTQNTDYFLSLCRKQGITVIPENGSLFINTGDNRTEQVGIETLYNRLCRMEKSSWKNEITGYYHALLAACAEKQKMSHSGFKWNDIKKNIRLKLHPTGLVINEFHAQTVLEFPGGILLPVEPQPAWPADYINRAEKNLECKIFSVQTNYLIEGLIRETFIINISGDELLSSFFALRPQKLFCGSAGLFMAFPFSSLVLAVPVENKNSIPAVYWIFEDLLKSKNSPNQDVYWYFKNKFYIIKKIVTPQGAEKIEFPSELIKILKTGV